MKLHYFFSPTMLSREREERDRDREGGGGLRKRGERRIKRVSWLAHTLLENKAGTVTTPILRS